MSRKDALQKWEDRLAHKRQRSERTPPNQREAAKMDVSEVAEMESAFLERSHRWMHNDALVDHPWTQCVHASAIRSRVDRAWSCIPPEYALVSRAALSEPASTGLDPDRMARAIETARDVYTTYGASGKQGKARIAAYRKAAENLIAAYNAAPSAPQDDPA